jgi:tetratricopeptide (TPR) repeat protein
MRMYQNKNSRVFFKILFFGLIISTAALVSAQTARTIVVATEPNASVWINDIKYGATDDGGKLSVKLVSAGAKTIRVRADGFKEATQNLTAAQKGEVKIALVKTTDEAELAFQKAETLVVTEREKAVEMYKKAIKLRPKYLDATIGLARALLASGDTDAALAAIKDARKIRPGYAEASAVEGRIYVAAENEKAAIAAFNRAITEGKGFQPEAHTGLGLFYRDKAEALGGAGDFEGEKANYLLAAAELKKAAAQLATAPDAIVVYQFLGDSYERIKMFQEAINVYEGFLKIFPDVPEATTVRSFIVQDKKMLE